MDKATPPTSGPRADATAPRARSAPEPAPIRVGLLSDLPIVAWGLEKLIESRQPSMRLVGTAHSLTEALHRLTDDPVDVMLFDLDGKPDSAGIGELIADGRTRVLALTTSRDPEFCDAAVLAGASGVVNKSDAPELLLKAIEKVHAGEFWLDRVATGRVFVAIARQRAARDPEQDKIARLTRKERMTVSETARDAAATGREIAQRLCISEHTLRNHLTSIYAKLGLRNRMELYAYAIKHRLVTAGGPRSPRAPGRAAQAVARLTGLGTSPQPDLD